MAYMVDDIVDIRIDGVPHNVKVILIESYESLERWINILIGQGYKLDTVANVKIVMVNKTDATDICLLKSNMGKALNMQGYLKEMGFCIPKVLKLSYLKI